MPGLKRVACSLSGFAFVHRVELRVVRRVLCLSTDWELRKGPPCPGQAALSVNSMLLFFIFFFPPPDPFLAWRRQQVFEVPFEAVR